MLSTPYVTFLIGMSVMLTIGITIFVLESLDSILSGKRLGVISAYKKAKYSVFRFLSKGPVVLGLIIFLAFVFLIFSTYLIVPSSRTWKEEIKETLINARPELIGAIFDLFLLFVFVEVIRERLAKNREVDDLIQQLKDYKGWHENAARFRVYGIYERLITRGVDWKSIDFEKLHIGNLPSGVISHIINSNDMVHTNLSNCTLNNTSLNNFSIKDSAFCDSKIWNVKLKEGIVEDVNFSNTIFNPLEFENVEFKNCNFTKCKFFGDVIGKELTFDDCLFVDSYFQRPDLEQIKFQSCKFKNMLFSSSNFENCDLIY